MKQCALWVDECAAWWNRYYLGFLKNAGLTSQDGHLSHYKAIQWAVLVSYCLGVPLPPSVAITILVLAFGMKVVLEGFKTGALKFSISISASDLWDRVTNKTESRSESHSVIERKGWSDEREFQES